MKYVAGIGAAFAVYLIVNTITKFAIEKVYERELTLALARRGSI